MKPDAARANTRSLAALDAMNMFMADVRDGLGPYLAIVLGSRHWDPGRIGIVLGTMTFATVIAQTPAGALLDRIRSKRGIVVLAALA
ncbi:MFS transporter, partial [Singulisphaera rosea]